MTTLAQASEAIAARFKTQWGALNPTIPFYLSGEVHAPPTRGQWLKLFVSQMSSGQATLGAVGTRKFIRRARVYIEVRDEADKGTLRCSQLAEQARAIFEGVSFSGLRFFGALVREAGEDGKWTTYLVDAPFDYHETK